MSVFDSVVRQPLPQLQQLIVTMYYTIDSQLMHCKKPSEEVLMWTLKNADDISLACDTAEKLRVAVTTMDATFLRWGLTISTKKTKVLVVGRNAAAQAADSVITLRRDQLEVVSQSKYLGCIFNSRLHFRWRDHTPSDCCRQCLPATQTDQHLVL